MVCNPPESSAEELELSLEFFLYPKAHDLILSLFAEHAKCIADLSISLYPHHHHLEQATPTSPDLQN